MNILQSLAGMGAMTEQVIATDFLLAAKTIVRNYSMAIAEAATPQVRETLRRHLNSSIETHEAITAYMMKKGYYHAYDPMEQIRVDMQAADTVMSLQQKG